MNTPGRHGATCARVTGWLWAILAVFLVGCASPVQPPASFTVVAADPAPPPPAAPVPVAVVAEPSPEAALKPLEVDLTPEAPRLDRATSVRAMLGSEDPGLGDQPDLWERVRSGFGMPDLDNDLVRKWEVWYSTRPDYVQRMTSRAGRYLFHILEEVEARGLPTELALVPFIESAFDPQAMSVARASGMWQFMPATGKHFELKQNVFRDDRRDVLASTRAALDYLQYLHRMFDDWHLALAAYNWGQGSVQRALARAQKAGSPTGYESLRMPDETRNYVPKLQAVKNILLRPDSFGLVLVPIGNHPAFLTVSIERDIDVDLAARLAGLPMDEFRALNPQMNKPVILAAGTPRILLPYDSANRFVVELAKFPGMTASWTAWVSPRTMKAAEAARLTGMGEPQLREVNRIPAGMLVKGGSTLLVPRASHALQDVAEHVADNGSLELVPEFAKARKGSGTAKGRGAKGVKAVAVASSTKGRRGPAAARTAKGPSKPAPVQRTRVAQAPQAPRR